MKSFFKQIGNKLAEAADNVAAYNSGAPELSGASGSRPAGQGPAQLKLTSGDPALEHLLRNVRSNLVRKHFFKTPASAYTHQVSLRVLAATYNVNGKKPPANLDLKEWLGIFDGDWPEGELGGKELPDIVVVGFQEIVPLNAGNVIIGSATRNLEAWDRAIGRQLNGETWAAQEYGILAADSSAQLAASNQALSVMDASWTGVSKPDAAPVDRVGAQFKHVASKQLVGSYLTVWVRTSLLPHIRGVQVTQVATGFGGYLGNKGAVAVRMQVYDSPIVLVNAHLSAGANEGAEVYRNSDVSEILQRADFSLNGDSTGSMSAPAAALISATLGQGHWGTMKGIADHGNAIWVGDLNYRLAPSVLPDEEVRKHLRAGQLQPLLAADQLCREMAGGRVFKGWQEAPITFAPTFKFKVGTNYYLGEQMPPSASTRSLPAAADDDGADEDGDEEGVEKQKKRTPAWCDRVLWLTSRKELHHLAYTRSELCASDHKPVAAAFLWQVRRYDRSKIESLLDEARRSADREAAAQRPRCTLEPVMLDAGDVPLTYGEARTLRVRVLNTGPVDGLFHWVPPPSRLGLDDEGPALPAWLTTSPAEGIVPAGGSTQINVTFRVEGGPHGSIPELLQEQVMLTGQQAVPAVAGGTAVAASQTWELFKIVILRVEDGGDLFLSLQGKYSPSYLGMPIPKLMAYQQGQLERQLVQLAVGSQSDLVHAQDLAATGPFFKLLSSHVQGSAADPDTAVAQLVPWQVRQLAAWLTASQATLSTPGLFTASAWQVLGQPQLSTSQAGSGAGTGAGSGGGAGTGTGAAGAGKAEEERVWGDREHVRALLSALAPLRTTLDAGGGGGGGGGVPSVHVAASLLLATFGELPQRLVPLTLVSACDSTVPTPGHALSQLAATLHIHELASLNHLLAVLRALPVIKAAPATYSASSPAAAVTAVASLVLMPVLGPGAPAEAAANRQAMIYSWLQL